VRTYRDLWRWLGRLFLTLAAFLTAIAIAYFLKDLRYALFGNFWMLAAIVAYIVAFSCFFGGIKGWAFPPWLKPRFPGLEVEIFGTGSLDTEREAGTGLVVPAHLRSFNVRITNTEAERDANLTVLLYVKLIPGSWGRAGECVCPPPQWTLPASLNLSPVSMPFRLAPGSAISGHLIYEIPKYYLDKVAGPMSARLELWDHVSGRRMNVPAEMGSYDRSRMVPSSGAAETLGPEYEAQLSLPGDASPAQQT
jgi:hypothetical protein